MLKQYYTDLHYDKLFIVKNKVFFFTVSITKRRWLHKVPGSIPEPDNYQKCVFFCFLIKKTLPKIK